jgi:hypothetical protein
MMWTLDDRSESRRNINHSTERHLIAGQVNRSSRSFSFISYLSIFSVTSYHKMTSGTTSFTYWNSIGIEHIHVLLVAKAKFPCHDCCNMPCRTLKFLSWNDNKHTNERTNDIILPRIELASGEYLWRKVAVIFEVAYSELETLPEAMNLFLHIFQCPE